MHVLTLEGDKLHSIIKCGLGRNLSNPYFFCLDPLNNLVISDNDAGVIRVSLQKVFSYTIGKEGHQQGMFYGPRGLAITPKLRLVCVSRNKNYGLQIYY
ncbi:hypothetical protein LOD99_7577 [Oopsacas minuta]|uniref:Uncharacterized protein n=1 Tax=Oopsacas minuta TaxID=111878 RepID=A0AAV7JNX2_9METZ|nr:hypothetical protein LOD99_7577 [Oopsacas minuta]